MRKLIIMLMTLLTMMTISGCTNGETMQTFAADRFKISATDIVPNTNIEDFTFSKEQYEIMFQLATEYEVADLFG